MQTTSARPPADPDQILRNLPRIGGVIPMYVDGGWRPAETGETRDLVNPSNGETIATVAEGAQDDAELAIRAARSAFDEGPWALDRARPIAPRCC